MRVVERVLSSARRQLKLRDVLEVPLDVVDVYLSALDSVECAERAGDIVLLFCKVQVYNGERNRIGVTLTPQYQVTYCTYPGLCDLFACILFLWKYECCGLVEYPYPHTDGLVRVSPKNRCQLHTHTCRGALRSECNFADNSRMVHGGGRAGEENWNGMDPKPLIGERKWMNVLEVYLGQYRSWLDKL